jgi:hypothetical protein
MRKNFQIFALYVAKLNKFKIMKTVSLDFNTLQIHAIFGNYIFLEGYFGNDEEDPIKPENNLCIIKIKKSLFSKAWKDYLIEKQRSCEAYKEACGVASVYAEDVTELIGIWHVLNKDYPFEEENPTDIPMYINVKIYTTNSIFVEVEHG